MNIKIKLVTLTLAGLFIVGIQKNSFINPFNLKTSTRNYISLRFIYDANGSGGQPYGASELNFQFKLF